MCLKDFIDWRYIHSWLVFSTQPVNCYPNGRVLSFFCSRRNWDSPNPSPAGECASCSLWFRGDGNTLAGERGGGRVPIPTRGHALWYSIFILYMYTLCHGVKNIRRKRPHWIPLRNRVNRLQYRLASNNYT